MKHRDTVTFGIKNTFKVVIPKDKKDDEQLIDVSDFDKVLEGRLNNDSKEAVCMRKYLEETRERIGENKTKDFVTQFQKALLRLDEANEYTWAWYVAFPLNRHYIYFTIEIMIDVLKYDVDEPEIAIRCRNAWTHEVNYLWSYEKFLERLELMRSWYADLMDDGIINRDHSIDPWSNVTDAELKAKKELEWGEL